MIRSIITFILLLAVVAQSFNKSIILLDYELNTIAFIKNCINKSRPEMQCHGKCQMKKKIQESESENKKQDAGINKSPHLELFFKSSYQSFLQVSVPLIKSSGFPLCMGQPISKPNRIFHPPLFHV